MVTHLNSVRFARGRLMKDAVVVSHRLILVVSGEINYTIDGDRRRLRAGDWFWVSAWSRREWSSGHRGCVLRWVEFTTDAVTVPGGWHLAAPLSADELEEIGQRYARLGRDLGSGEELAKLRLEAETKALAALFWSRLREAESPAGERAASHPEMERALAWLEANCLRPDALDVFYREVLTLSPNHFRLLYRRQTGETVQGTLARLRLRRARYLIVQTALSIKEIAAECGFADPLYFSNHYKRFWGTSPSADRGGDAVA